VHWASNHLTKNALDGLLLPNKTQETLSQTYFLTLECICTSDMIAFFFFLSFNPRNSLFVEYLKQHLECNLTNKIQQNNILNKFSRIQTVLGHLKVRSLFPNCVNHSLLVQPLHVTVRKTEAQT
jgi:hypothetical protein